MDSTEFNKIAGGLIGAFLVFMLLNFVSGQIYGTGGGEGYGEEPLAFALETESADADGEGDDAAEATDYAALVANADAANGEKVYKKCKACHALEEGKNGVGPSLWGVVGRDIAALTGFGFSSALTGLEGNWDLTALSAFLKDPKGYAPGTKMSFAGVKDDQDRVDLIAYLNEVDGSPVELAAAPSAGDGANVDDARPEDTATSADDEPADDAAKPEDTGSGEDGGTSDAEGASTDDTRAEDDGARTEDGDNTAVAATDQNKDEGAPSAGGHSEAFAGGDAQAGEKVFRKCKACHKLEEGKHSIGPSLYGIINRDIASSEGYNYSKALQDLPGTWTATELAKFLAKPKDYAKGSKMVFNGLKKDEDVVNLLTYLNEADGSPDPLQ